MSAAAIVAQVRDGGRSIRLEGENLRIVPRLTPDLLAEVRAHKAQIVALLEAETDTRAGPCFWHRFATARDDANQPFSRCLDCAHANPAPVLRRDPRDPSLEAARLLRDGRWSPTLPVCAFHCGKPGETCRRCGAPWDEHYPVRREGSE